MKGKVAILVGGGPAPGINGVIAAATIAAVNRGYEVVGIMDGFKHLSRGETLCAIPLSIDQVSRIHFRGGSILGTSRDNPTRSPGKRERVVSTLRALNVDHLITIGGEDTATSSFHVQQASAGVLRTVHVPKTIDNDLPLPGNVPTFGFETARHVGAGLVANLMEDSKTTKRWFFVVAMGRYAGHLTLGIAKAAGATLAIIPEEFPQGTTLGALTDILDGAIVKRLAMGRSYGVAMIAEGVAEKLMEEEIGGAVNGLRDEHGHLRLAELGFAETLKRRVEKQVKGRGLEVAITDKNVGYELRSAPPIPFDAEYTRNLGYAAVKFLAGGGTGAMVAVWGGAIMTIPFTDMVDPVTKRARLRLVDIQSDSYEVALSYMIRLRKHDFTDGEFLRTLAGSARMDVESFRSRFESVAV